MNSAVDPIYVAARTVLLDALEALGPHRSSVILVGAQAVYLRSPNVEMAVAPHTTDADLAVSPAELGDSPLIQELLAAAGFSSAGDPGSWQKQLRIGSAEVTVPLDLMVPTGYASPDGRRGARIPPHDSRVARKCDGLEGAILDHDVMSLSALDTGDTRNFETRVSGVAALIMAKSHKLRDRLMQGKADRIANKDAADVYRLMLAAPLIEFTSRYRPLLSDQVTSEPAQRGLEYLEELFGSRASQGILMAGESLRVAVPRDRIVAVCTSFTRQFLSSLS